MPLFGKKQNDVALAAVTPSDGASAAGVGNVPQPQRPPLKNKKERLKRAEEETNQCEIRLKQVQGELKALQRELNEKKRVQDQTATGLKAVENDGSLIRAYGSKTQGELKQAQADCQSAEDEIAAAQEATTSDQAASTVLTRRLDRLRSLLSALKAANTDASQTRVEGAVRVVVGDANKLSEDMEEDLGNKLYDNISELTRIELKRSVFDAERTKALTSLNTLELVHSSSQLRRKESLIALQTARVDNEELRQHIRNTRALLESAEQCYSRLQGEHDMLAREIEERGDRTKALGTVYCKEVGCVVPTLATAKQWKQEADALHGQRLEEFCEALQIPRLDATLNSRPQSRLDSKGTCTCVAPMFVDRETVPTLSLDQQLQEIINTAKEVAYGPGHSHVMRKAGRIVVGEVSGTFA